MAAVWNLIASVFKLPAKPTFVVQLYRITGKFGKLGHDLPDQIN